MREILFRGKRLDNGEWVEGFYVHIPSGRYEQDEHLIQTIKDTGKIGILMRIDPSTICQFIGICDKDGKKIFEGDILHYWSEYCEEYLGRCVVKYGKFNCGCCDGVYGWYLEGGDIRDFNGNYPTDYEVCGNIYDHLELLEDVGR